MTSPATPGALSRADATCPARQRSYTEAMQTHLDRRLDASDSRSARVLIASAAFVVVAIALAACASAVVPDVPTALPSTPTPTPTLVPTWTPTPVPTATPIPPALLTIDWPETVSPLNSVPIEVSLVAPPGLAANATILATVMDPVAQVYATFALTERRGDRYGALEELSLPFTPLPGYWWLIVHVESQLPIVGDPALFFEIDPVPLRDLGAGLPAAVTLQVPQAFAEAVAQGDAQAGGRVWTYGRGEVGLWWAPGPMEALTMSNALVLLEATHAADGRFDAPPALSEALPTTWQDASAFEFPEVWPGPAGGPGRAWVIKGADHMLYVLRVRALGAGTIPALHAEVAETFGFTE
jgi:hypothetical protein